jgi:2-haloacid dehalogenase/putative hydrolase of the HAD superfamily
MSDNEFDLITFDCYGTLIDWEQGLITAFQREATRLGRALEAAAIVAAYHAEEAVVESESYRAYRDVLTETGRRVAARLGLPIEAERAAFLAESLPHWPPFADTNAALERLAQRYGLGILSNIDDDLLALTRRHFTVEFDLIVTAQQVGSYKPAHGHFIEARRRKGAARWLHAAQSNFHDIVPANALGIPNAWINRHHEQPLPNGTPGREFSDLTGLADWLA